MESLNEKSIQNKRVTGKMAEELAIQYLLQNGYLLLTSNWYFGHKELDIIVESLDFRIFIEVKSRVVEKSKIHYSEKNKSKSSLSLTPENKVNTDKKKSISICANEYNKLFPTTKEIRFDIIAITQKYYGIQLLHFKNAFSPVLAQSTAQIQSYFGKSVRKRSKRWNVFYI